MLIDVHDSFLNLVLNISFIIIIVLGMASVIPWPLRSGRNRWTLVLPFATIAIYTIYEYCMPGNWDIRIDLLIIWPVILISMVMGAIRGIVVWRRR